MNARTAGMIALAGTLGFGVAACDDGGTTAIEPETALLSVAPAGGAAAVALDSEVVVTFDHPMHDHAADYMAVHEGGVTGPTVAGAWMMEANGTVMRFTPDHGWDPGSDYAVHLGGGMMDAEGNHLDMGTHGSAMGGEWATSGMMSGGMHGGQHGHMGNGWDHPENGSHGMIFTFTTAA